MLPINLGANKQPAYIKNHKSRNILLSFCIANDEFEISFSQFWILVAYN